MENEKTIRLDFSHVMLEENIGVFTEADLSKHVGNRFTSRRAAQGRT